MSASHCLGDTAQGPDKLGRLMVPLLYKCGGCSWHYDSKHKLVHVNDDMHFNWATFVVSVCGSLLDLLAILAGIFPRLQLCCTDFRDAIARHILS